MQARSKVLVDFNFEFQGDTAQPVTQRKGDGPHRTEHFTQWRSPNEDELGWHVYQSHCRNKDHIVLLECTRGRDMSLQEWEGEGRGSVTGASDKMPWWGAISEQVHGWDGGQRAGTAEWMLVLVVSRVIAVPFMLYNSPESSYLYIKQRQACPFHTSQGMPSSRQWWSTVLPPAQQKALCVGMPLSAEEEITQAEIRKRWQNITHINWKLIRGFVRISKRLEPEIGSLAGMRHQNWESEGHWDSR